MSVIQEISEHFSRMWVRHKYNIVSMKQSIEELIRTKEEIITSRFSRDWRVVSYDDIAANYWRKFPKIICVFNETIKQRIRHHNPHQEIPDFAMILDADINNDGTRVTWTNGKYIYFRVTDTWEIKICHVAANRVSKKIWRRVHIAFQSWLKEVPFITPGIDSLFIPRDKTK